MSWTSALPSSSARAVRSISPPAGAIEYHAPLASSRRHVPGVTRWVRSGMPHSDLEPKLLSVLREGYSRHQLLQDVLAGIVVGVVALPLAIAFAIASGVRPEQGLITAILAGFIVSAL